MNANNADLFVMVGLFVIISFLALWSYLIEPRTNIGKPTKEIVKLLEGGKRFKIRRATHAEVIKEDGYVDFIIHDLKTHHTTGVWYSPHSDQHILSGDLDWMGLNEQKLVGKVSSRIREGQIQKELDLAAKTKLEEDQKRRKKAVERYK